ncbi:MAG: lipid-A-disaccharide synthase [Rubrivivax sp.]
MDIAAAPLAMVAGEASGDLLASLLIGGLRQRWPGLRTVGIGGPEMAAQGFEAWWPHHKLAVHGVVDALRHLREIWGIRNALAERLLQQRPSAFVGVDAPDFNLGLEGRLRRSGIRTIQFVCPSIWAWRGGRVKRIARDVDHVLCLFPFEPELLRRAGVAASYVGHPLADVIPLQVPRAEARLVLGLAEHDAVVAVLPGSRLGEIRLIAPPFLQAVALLHRSRPHLRFVLPVTPGMREPLTPMLDLHAPGVPIQLIDGRSRDALAACDVTLIASGTATLEAALFKRPMVIGYRSHWLNAMLWKRIGYLPWVGLPNILCRESVVPELLQDHCQPRALADAVLERLDDTAGAERLATRFTELHLLLRRDTARCATDAIAQVLDA